MLSSPYTPEAIGWGVFSDGRLLAPLCKHLSAAASARLSMGLSVLDRYAPDLFGYVFTLPDRIQHPMLKFAFPEVYRELAQTRGGEYLRLQPTADQVAQFGDVVNETYRQVDRWMGKILDRAEADTWVVVVSDHGAAAGPHPYQATAGIHHPDGIYVIAKARAPDGVEPETDLGAVRGPELVLEDTTPIILHLLGLPVAADMIGQVPEFLVQATQAVTTIPSYEKGGAQSAGTQSEGMDPALEEQLRSLGYVE